MQNEKTSVFFDTNSYRKIVLNSDSDKITTLLNAVKSAEKIKNIEPISTFTTNLELIANLVEGKQGVNYDNCHKSLFFLTNHCYDSDEKEIRISSLPFLQISAIVFGALPINFRKDAKKFSSLFETFRTFDTEPKIKENFYELVKTSLKTHELDFSNNLSNLIEASNLGMEQMHPRSRGKIRRKKLIEYFRSEKHAQSLAMNSLKIVAKRLEIDLSDDEFQKRAYFLRKQLPLSVAFFQWILCEIIEKNIDLKSSNSQAKRWNWIWDYQISYLISESTINDGKILLVTSDKDIIKILKANNLEKRVMNLEEYLKFLNINGSSQQWL